MNDEAGSGLLLGQQTPPVLAYAPELLFPIARQSGRASLDAETLAHCHGVDVWHAYELSWLDGSGKPVARIGRFTVPANSPNIIESKSFKLYLNSLNSESFADSDTVKRTLVTDLSAVAGSEVAVEICDIDDPEVAAEPLEATCIDDAPLPQGIGAQPEPSLLAIDAGRRVKESLASHLLRSLCPVTGQPDWASIRIRYQGPAIERSALLAYLLGFRNHQEFHEQCVERIYCDLMAMCSPDSLTVQAFYTRRGGLDINPLRSTEADAIAGPRLLRQ